MIAFANINSNTEALSTIFVTKRSMDPFLYSLTSTTMTQWIYSNYVQIKLSQKRLIISLFMFQVQGKNKPFFSRVVAQFLCIQSGCVQ